MIEIHYPTSKKRGWLEMIVPKIVAAFGSTLERDNFSSEGGTISVVKTSDTVFVLEFSSHQSSSALSVDLDDVEVVEDAWSQRLEFFAPDDGPFPLPGGKMRCSVHFHLDGDFAVLKELLENCREVVELTVRLNSTLRDCFYGGVYTQVPDQRVVAIQKELLGVASRSVFDAGVEDVLESLGLLSSEERLCAMGNRGIGPGGSGRNFVGDSDLDDDDDSDDLRWGLSTTSSSTGSISTSMGTNAAGGMSLTQTTNGTLKAPNYLPRGKGVPACCVYCQVTNLSARPGQKLATHPYVAKDYSGRTMNMCTVCIHNWQVHRDAAKDSGQLVLEGEVNEELCAVCSDSPRELVMCSGCPRSYCIRCLGEILTKGEFSQMQSADDWTCMCCALEQAEALKAQKKLRANQDKEEKRAKRNEKDKIRRAEKRKQEALRKAEKSMGGEGVDKRLKLPPVNTQHDDAYYFGQYLSFCRETYDVPSATEISKARAVGQLQSEDICFLCKDGGDLIECDFKHPAPTSSSAKGGKGKAKGESEAGSSLCCPCLKVYHEYCLNYAVGDEEWRCPRHFCDSCGSKAVFYMCKYCPIAICERCPGKFSSTYGLRDFLAVPRRIDKLKSSLRDEVGAQNQDIQLIVCATCIKSITKAVERGDVEPSFAVDTKKIKQFPLTPSGSSSAGSGKERKKSSGESYDEEQLKRVMGISSP